MLTSLFATTDHLDHCCTQWDSVWKNKKETRKCFWSHYWSHELPHRLKHCGILKTLLCGLQWWSSRWKSAQIWGLWCNLRDTCGSLKDSLKLKSETVFVFLLVTFWNFFFSLHVACSTFLNTHTSHVWTSVVSSLCCAFNCCQPV